MYLITGATGHIGNLVARDLLSKGKKVRVVSRHEDKLKDLVKLGAEAFAGDVLDHQFVNKAFNGIEAAFCLLPPNLLSKNVRSEQQKIARNYTDAVKSNGVKSVILLSSIGAHIGKGSGIVDGLADLESYFSELKDVNVLNLRPGYFMENLYVQLGTIKSSGIIGTGLKTDLRIPLVATKDIAAIVSKHLISLNFRGNIIEYVLGPKDLDFNEITRIIGKAIDRNDLKYVQYSMEEWKKGLIQSGYVSENVAELYTEMTESFNSGKALNAHKRTSENTTPTTLEDFAKNLSYEYHHLSAA